MAGGRLHATERHQARAGVDALLDVVRLEPAAAERDLADVVALALEQPPREVVRAVLPLPDDDVVAGGRGAELRRDQAGRRRHRRDQRNVRGVGPHETGRLRPGVVRGLLAAGEVQAVRDPVVDGFVVGPGQRVAGEPDGRGVEVAPVRGRGKQEPRFGDVRDGYVGLRIGHDVTVRANLGHDALRPGGGVFAGALPVVWLHRDEGSRGRLPRGRRRGQRHGVHRCADRPRRRARRTRRPSPRRRWPLARGLPLRPAAPVVDLLRRRVDGAGRWSYPGARTRGGAARARRPAHDLRLLRKPAGGPDARVGPGRALRRLRVPGRPHLRLARLGTAVRGAATLPGRRRALPVPRHPGRDPAEVRCRRRRAGDPGQRPRAHRGGSEPVRRRRARARPRPMPASGCSRVGWIPTRSAGCAHAIPGCSTGR